MELSTLGEKIKFFRKRAGLSQMELEFRINAAAGSISRTENNLVNPTKETLLNIAKELKLGNHEFLVLMGFQDNFKFSFLNFSIESYTGKKKIREICQKTVERSPKEVLYISNLSEWRKVYPEEYGKRYYIPERRNKNIFLKMLAVQDEKALKFQQNDNQSFRQTKLLPSDYNIQDTLIITQNDLVILRCEKPYTSTIIKDISIANSFRNNFNVAWNYLNPVI